MAAATPSTPASNTAAGTPQRVYFISLGCPKNQVDSEVMLGEVSQHGHTIADTAEDADVIVVNTCAFIDAAKEESIDTILEMAEHKKHGGQKLVVTGCLAQRYAADIAKDIPEIDHILGSADFSAIASIIGPGAPTPATAKPAAKGKGRRQLPVIKVSETPAYIYDATTPRVRIGKGHTAYVKIAEGCDRPCSFCIIPKLRGPQRSRSIEDIAREVTQLAGQGVKEINLIAQDLTRYGWDLEGRPTLAQLLAAIAHTDGIEWIRLHYTFPSAFSDELIDIIAKEPKIAKYIDVPLQHISDDMLKIMRRGHSSRVTRALVQTLRERIPGVVIRTTFIVGHPGETDASFEELYNFVKEAEFDHMGAFTYSVEPGTHAAELPDQVAPKIMLARQERLMELQRQISLRKNEARVGQEMDILIEGVSDESEYLLQGRWYGQAPGIDGTVYVADGTANPGDLVRARVTQGSDYDLAVTMEL
ncbi:MAG: 30S ribosomal protein S12 methylthiotransferase RimO [Myxococcales bacterium]|nr:30S ribosomal protein S12 methylthiotransferase RimO [Myxococcales bacterium]